MINVRNLINDYCNDSFSSKEIDLICGYWIEVFTGNIYIAWQEILNGYVPNNKASEVPLIISLSGGIDNNNNFNWHEHLRWAVFNIISGHTLDNFNFSANHNQLHTKKIYFKPKMFTKVFKILKPSRNSKILFFAMISDVLL